MNFKVIYRNKQGSRDSLVLDVEDRAKVFAICRERGITPITVSEGTKSSPKVSGVGAAKKNHGLKYVLPFSALAAVLIATLVYLCCSPIDKKPVSTIAKPMSVAKPARPTPPPAKKEKTVTQAPPPLAQVVTNKVVSPEPDFSGMTAKQIADARRAIRATNGYIRVKKESHFKGEVNQALAMLASVPPGQTMPPIPMRPRMEERIRAELDLPIEILETDSDRVKEMKQTVQQTRDELKRLLEEGMTFQQIISEHRNIVNENVEIRRKAIAEAREILESGNREEAEKYVRTINIAFQQMGIPEMNMPQTKEERHAAAMARIAERRRKAEEAKSGIAPKQDNPKPSGK